jgi:hypothetical protein
MPRQSKKTIAAKQTRLAEIVASNPGVTIKAANEALKSNGFQYRLTPFRASPVVRASRTAVKSIQTQIATALGLTVRNG